MRTSKTESKLDDLRVPLAGWSLRVIVPVVGVIFALPVIGLSPASAAVLGKGSSILLIVTVAWVLIQAVSLGEKTVLAKYDIKVPAVARWPILKPMNFPRIHPAVGAAAGGTPAVRSQWATRPQDAPIHRGAAEMRLPFPAGCFIWLGLSHVDLSEMRRAD